MVETRKRGRESNSEHIRGKSVLVPTNALAALAAVYGPSIYLHGMVKGKDPSHKGCVLVKCREDPRTFFFDAGQVQRWIQEQEQDGFAVSMDADIPPGQGVQQQGGGMQAQDQHKGFAAANTLARQGTASMSRPPTGPPRKGTTKKAEVADLTGKEVDIPGSVFHDHTPGLFFRASVTGPDAAHASAVVLRMLNNPRSRYYFHASEVRAWLRMMQLRASAEGDSKAEEQDALDDAQAAEVLARMSAGGSSSSLFPSTNTALLAVQSPLSPFDAEQAPPHKKQQQEQQQQQGLLATPSCVRCAHGLSLDKPALQWDRTELIAQCPSLLPLPLAQRLAGIANSQNKEGKAAST